MARLGIGKLLSGVRKGAAKGAQAMVGGSSGVGRALPAMLMGGAFVAGAGSVIGPATRDAALEAGFGTDKADMYFTGRKLSARTLAGAAMGGRLGGALQQTSPGDYFATNPIRPTMGQVAGFGGLGGVSGGIAGGMLGAKKGGIKGGIGGALLGAFGGATLGTGIGLAGIAAETKSYVNNNSKFFSQSPYAPNSSRMVADSLNASGDIVLGMHNSRRGY